MNQLLQHPAGKIIVLSLVAILGVNARYWLGIYIQRFEGGFPWATIIINLSGCILVGLLMGVTASKYQSDMANQLRLIIGTGFLGTYTTFSAFAFDTVALGVDREGSFMLFNILISVVGGCLVAWLGYVAGKAM